MILCGRGLRKGTILPPGLWSFVREEAVPWHLSWWQTLQFLPICHWCPSRCHSGAGAQREWVCIRPKSVVGPLGGDAWESPTPTGFTARSYGDLSSWHWNPGLGSLVWGGDLSLPLYLSRFLSTTRGLGPPIPCIHASPSVSESPSLLPIWINVASLIPWLSYFHTAQFSDNSGW